MSAHIDRMSQDAMEALWDIMQHHAGQRNMMTKMLERDPPFGGDEMRERTKQRLANHMHLLNQVEVVGEALDQLRLTEGYANRLASMLEAKHTVLARVRDEVMKHPVLRAPLLYVWKRLTSWGV